AACVPEPAISMTTQHNSQPAFGGQGASELSVKRGNGSAVSEADFAFQFPENDAQAPVEPHGTARHQLHRGGIDGAGKRPFLFGHIFKTPNSRICRVRSYLRNGTGKVVWLLLIHVMREELRVMVEHYGARPMRIR